MAADDAVVVTKEMAVTHADFFRSLANAFPETDYQVNGSKVIVAGDGRSLEIALGPEGVRQIALLKLPQTPVTLTFQGYSEEAREAALDQFDRAFQRAGG